MDAKRSTPSPSARTTSSSWTFRCRRWTASRRRKRFARRHGEHNYRSSPSPRTPCPAAASGSGVEIAKAAHVFRGAAATIGARALAELLERVETTARAGELDEARDYFEQVSPIAHSVIEYLRQQRAAMTEA